MEKFEKQTFYCSSLRIVSYGTLHAGDHVESQGLKAQRDEINEIKKYLEKGTINLLGTLYDSKIRSDSKSHPKYVNALKYLNTFFKSKQEVFHHIDALKVNSIDFFSILNGEMDYNDLTLILSVTVFSISNHIKE